VNACCWLPRPLVKTRKEALLHQAKKVDSRSTLYATCSTRKPLLSHLGIHPGHDFVAQTTHILPLSATSNAILGKARPRIPASRRAFTPDKQGDEENLAKDQLVHLLRDEDKWDGLTSTSKKTQRRQDVEDSISTKLPVEEVGAPSHIMFLRTQAS
jgi:hypothetical protein